jgi:hypothetical protein
MIQLTSAKHEFFDAHMPGIGFDSTLGERGDSSVCTDFKPAPASRLGLSGPRQHGLGLTSRGLHRYQVLLARVDAWITDNAARRARGEDRLMFPLDMVEEAQAIAPSLADRMAAIDLLPPEGQNRLQRFANRQPPAYSAAADKPKDEALCRRLGHACRSLQTSADRV